MNSIFTNIEKGMWVKAKWGSEIRLRYVTEIWFPTDKKGIIYFEDDGKMSGIKPAKHCRASNYEPVDESVYHLSTNRNPRPFIKWIDKFLTLHQH